MNRIDALFAGLKAERRTALIPFLTAGDPDLPTTAALVRAFVARGADLLELGVPYSDPIADGPVISASYSRALTRGIRLDAIFEMAKGLRPSVSAPMVTMVSFGIVYRRGVASYLEKCLAAGIDGLIVPDLPVEEAEDLHGQATERGLKLIQLVTPRTPRERVLAIARTTSGFLYYVSVAGITGERQGVPVDLAEKVGWLREQSDLPICVGFGIGSAEQVRALAPLVDGLIVGSAIVRRIAEATAANLDGSRLVGDLADFVGGLSAARPG